MNTISTIVGPSITLAHPFVGSSLASDWGAWFLKSNDNIWPSCSLKSCWKCLLPLYIHMKLEMSYILALLWLHIVNTHTKLFVVLQFFSQLWPNMWFLKWVSRTYKCVLSDNYLAMYLNNVEWSLYLILCDCIPDHISIHLDTCRNWHFCWCFLIYSDAFGQYQSSLLL